MKTPTRTEVLDHVSAHFGMPRIAVLELFKTPTHPADMRDNAAIMALQGLLACGKSIGITGDVQTAFAYADKFMEERTK